MKRVLVINDLHAGHRVGLTHPDFDATPSSPGYNRDLYNIRRRCWRFYAEKVDALKPIHLLIVNGDCIDGKGKKSGGTELITADRTEQITMATEAIKYVEAANIVMSYGTPYHTGKLEDWEKEIAEKVKAIKISGQDWVDVNGLVFDYRHFIGSSQIPHGRYTAIAREKLWNTLWNEHDEYPKADVIIRSHVHYHAYCGGYGWLGMTTPALQFYGTKFGARKVSGTVDFGMVSFDVVDKDNFSWESHIWKPRMSKRHIIQV